MIKNEEHNFQNVIKLKNRKIKIFKKKLKKNFFKKLKNSSGRGDWPAWCTYLLLSVFFFFTNFLLAIYFISIPNVIPKIPYILCPPPSSPIHPLPLLSPGVAPVLVHIKFARPSGLSSQWWQTRPSSATYSARDTSSGGYWLVHIVVLYISWQTPSAP